MLIGERGERREPTIEKKEIELTPEEKLIKRGVEIEREGNEIKKMPEVRDLGKKLDQMNAMKNLAKTNLEAAEKKRETANREVEKRKKDLHEIESKGFSIWEKRMSFFNKVDEEEGDRRDDQKHFLTKTVLEKMGYGPKIDDLRPLIRSRMAREGIAITELSPDERKFAEKKLNREATYRVRDELSEKDRETFTTEYEGAEKDFNKKLELARKKEKEKKEK